MSTETHATRREKSKADESAISRILYWSAVTLAPASVIHLRPALPRASSNLPRNLNEQLLSVSLFGFAPGGVCLAMPVTWRAGGLLHHRFTLTAARCGGLLSVALIPRVTPGGRYPPPCSVESGLSSAQISKHLQRDRLADSSAFHYSTRDRKSTRLNSSHVAISYAVF